MENEGNDDNRRIDEEDDLNEIDLNQIEIAANDDLKLSMTRLP